ncbi:MAG: ABC transporter substrate-binding protein [Deltaproteobacteria bacterium]|nr:ABC transporter substrate-binding protein [Deltaproteobacteria bacterium]
MAVEFVDHASCAFVAFDKKMFEREGVDIKSYNTYVTGMALSAAMTRGDIDAAYMCLIPAISAYANGKVPLKVVAGTHKYGYGLIVDSGKVKSVADLAKPEIRIGCPSEGSPPDILINVMMEKFHLDKNGILKKTRRMSPPKLLMALKMGQLDAAFLPEQFPTMGEETGFTMLLTARDLWPDMQGSVLVVTEGLIEENQEVVEKIVKVTNRATAYLNAYPEEASQIVARSLSAMKETEFTVKIGKRPPGLDITPSVILRSITTRMECTSHIDKNQVQKTINAMAKLGYIEAFDASNILDLRWNHD